VLAAASRVLSPPDRIYLRVGRSSLVLDMDLGRITVNFTKAGSSSGPYRSRNTSPYHPSVMPLSQAGREWARAVVPRAISKRASLHCAEEKVSGKSPWAISES
jgi:hypothetical protein